MTERESAPLLSFLMEHGHRPEFTCRFRWRPGSVAFWDKRSAKHLAIDDAGLTAADIDYVNAHGTSTHLNDEGESLAIKSVWGEHAKDVSVSSIKSMTGHLLGAAGGIEAVATALTVENDMMPPTINYETPDEGLDLDYVPNKARAKKVRAAISNNFGFGGHNACIVMKKYTE